MTLRIEWDEGQMRLCGELRSEHLDEVKAELERHGSTVALDLEELDLVDVEAIRFFKTCEAKGISVSHCSPYIRAWMAQERERRAQQNKTNGKNRKTKRRSEMNTPKPSIIFCHGIWADGSSFSKVIPPLQAEGFEVIAAQYGLDTPEGDVATVKRTLGRVSSPAILVGHSYGGSVITAAGTDHRVAGLVYIAALANDSDETSQSQQEKFPVTDVFKYVELAEGRLWMRPEGVVCFAGDLPEQEQKLVWATHYAPAADLFGRNAPGVAWKSKPSWYIVANNDRTVQPELERFLAKRMGASTHAVDSSHVPMLSHPGFVVDVIRQAANAVQESIAGKATRVTGR